MLIASAPHLAAFRAFIRSAADARTGVTRVTGVTPESTTPCGLPAGVTRVTGGSSADTSVDGEALERQAIAEMEGGVPALYSQAFATLQITPPAGVSVSGWLALVDEAGRLLDAFGHQAAALGWSADDLFGRNGLVCALNGASVVALTRGSATLSDGRTVRPSVG